MNILFFATSNFKPDSGGIAELGHQLATALCKIGNNVTVIAGGEKDSDDNHQPYSIVRTSKSQPKSLAQDLAKELHLAAVFVLVIGSSWRTAKWISRKFDIPLVLYIHGLEITKRNNSYPVFAAKQFVKGWILKKSDLVLCNSFNTMLLSIKRGADPKKVRVLNPGISLRNETRKPVGYRDPAPDKIVFFTMGRLIRRKGVDNTIRALPLIIEEYPNLLYVIAGDGLPEYRQELEKIAASLGVSEYVLFLGRIDEYEKERWYYRHDIFIMPSRRLADGDVEGFGIVFLEAGAWGKPVIGGMSGGVPDAIEDGKSGFLVNPESIEDIAYSMRILLASPEKRVTMGIYGRKRVEKHFSWEHQAERFVNLIQPVNLPQQKKDFNDWKDLPKNETLNKKISKENLLILKETFDAAGLPFMIFFGTLLGAFREHDFITHDTDTDIILFESYRDLFNEVLPELEAQGLILTRSVKENRVLSLYRNGEYIDLYFVILKRIGIRKKWYIDLSSVSKNYLLSYKYYEFLGELFKVPENSVKVLKELYGRKWKIPVKDYEANHDYIMKLNRFIRRKNKRSSVGKFIKWIRER